MSAKRDALEQVIAKLAKLLPMLASDKDGEVVNAAQAIKRLLASVKLDFHDLVTFLSGNETQLHELLRSLFEKEADALLRLGLAGAALFHSDERVAFADVVVAGKRKTWQLSDPGFGECLLHQYFLEQRKAPGLAAMKSTIRSLSAYAVFQGEQHEVHLRIAESGGRMYLDLADAAGHGVEIDTGGWRVLGNPPVRFRRTPGMRSLPLPQRGGAVHQLRQFVNLSDNDFTLFVAVLLSAFRVGRPQPVLVLCGEEGAAKTTLARIHRLLIDPSSVPLRTLPTTVRDLFIFAHNEYALGFDNVSKITPAISDAICQISSGSGFSTRRLYTDCEEFQVSGSCPVVLNSIANPITRPDLADRAVVQSLSPIRQRRRESEFWEAFELERASILGALLDAVAHGLRELPNVHSQRLPRMADFATWGVACEGAYVEPGSFLRAFETSAAETVTTVIEQDCVATAVGSFMIDRDHWQGTATQLLHALASNDCTEAQVSGWRDWPRDASDFGRRLRRAAASLRKIGVAVDFGKARDRRQTRIVELSKVEAQSPQSDPRAQHQPSAAAATGADRADSADGADGTVAYKNVAAIRKAGRAPREHKVSGNKMTAPSAPSALSARDDGRELSVSTRERPNTHHARS